jgi:hypothetical protein
VSADGGQHDQERGLCRHELQLGTAASKNRFLNQIRLYNACLGGAKTAKFI